jgi:hypothetical protein
MCQVKPHQAMTQAKNETMKRDTTMIAMACPTDNPCVRNVLGVCQVDMLSAPLEVEIYMSRLFYKQRQISLTYRDCTPKKLNHPQVLLAGGMGTKSRLHQAVVSSWRDSSALRTAASLIVRMVLVTILL